MKFGVSWRRKDIKAEARETAKEAARRAGVSVDDWMNFCDPTTGRPGRSESAGRRAFIRRSDHRRASAPRRPLRARPSFHRLGRRGAMPRAMCARRPPRSWHPHCGRPSWTARSRRDRCGSALRSTAIRRRSARFQNCLRLPRWCWTQNFVALQAQLRGKITDEIETLRTPGVEQAINALREELAEIGRTLNVRMPRRELEAIERADPRTFPGVSLKARQAGVDAGAPAGIVHGLAEVRDGAARLDTRGEPRRLHRGRSSTFRRRRPDRGGQVTPPRCAELEGAITTLRGLVSDVASNETVSRLAAEVQALAEKIDNIGHAGPAGDVLASLERKIDALDHVDRGVIARWRRGIASAAGSVHGFRSPTRSTASPSGYLSVAASRPRRPHRRAGRTAGSCPVPGSAISNRSSAGSPSLLVHIEDTRGARPSSTTEGFAVEALREDFAQTHDALEAMHGTLGLVVDPLAGIEHDIRGDEPRPGPGGRRAARTVQCGRCVVDADNRGCAGLGARTASDPAAAFASCRGPAAGDAAAVAPATRVQPDRRGGPNHGSLVLTRSRCAPIRRRASPPQKPRSATALPAAP